ncbi:Dyp-type peroxidase [Flavobacterium sp. ACN6]|uniref:Dyp-type peroxidase n=1 Tax=Flavobacterium sp. ACN6 TaxID=1920426 RepID=UPI0011435B32|nr:Dyp-type peroxidase [Flavobacterium sp. ACN6]PBJ08083.1 Deferrochelatase/peroxidase EfeB precursor [Flavobacterium sp. ACN6]
MALTLEESKVNTEQHFSEMLNDLQANILKHHGRNFAYHLFLAVKEGKADEAKNWITNFATSKITSTAKQLIDSNIRKQYDIDGGTVYTLSLSKSGYDKLEIDSEIIPENEAFQEGLKNRSTKLADDPEDWDDEFKSQIDVLIIIGHADKDIAVNRKDNLILQLSPIFDIAKVQAGEILRNGAIGIEHFGYADGVSQPLFLEKEILEQNSTAAWNDEATLNLALVKDKGGKFADSFGSYLVFRKLEQNVMKFNTEEDSLPAVKDQNGAANDELAGAMIVGRFEDGTEVVNKSSESGHTSSQSMINDFNYSTDPDGSECPFHSHIRITNPRSDVGDDFAKSVRLVRRGIPYNDIGRVGTEGKPADGVGLLFMCYQSSIERQFEFIQQSWVNHGEIRPGRFVGQDGLIGQGVNNDKKHLPEQWGELTPKNTCDFSNPESGFVTMKGGEYFFTPSISFLKSLALEHKMVLETAQLSL